MHPAFPCALLLGCLHAAAPPAPRADLYGDPLPAGAVARLGSVRLRHAGLSDYVCLPDSKTVVTAGSDRVLRHWDLATGRQRREVRLEGRAGPGRAVTLSPDGKTLAALDGGQVILWEADSGREVKRLPGPKGRAIYLYFSPDGRTLAVGREEPRVTLWDWQAGKQRELALPLRAGATGQYAIDSSTHAAFSPDGKWLIAGANSMEPLGVFDLATGREVHRLACHALTSAVSPDSKTLAVSSWRNDKGEREAVLRLFDLKSGKPLKQYPRGNNDSYFSLAFSPDGKALACGFSDQSCLLDLTTGRILRRFTARPIVMAFTPDGKTLLASAHSHLRAWDPATGKELHDSPEGFDYTVALAATPDSRLLATANWMDQEVRLWETARGRLARRLPLKGDGRYVRTLAFSPDGRTLFACQYRGLIQSWDAATGRERPAHQLKDPNHPHRDGEHFFYRFHLSADGKSAHTMERIMGREESTRLALWDLASGKPLRRHLFAGEVRDGACRAGGGAVALCLRGGLSMVDVEDGTEHFHIAGADAPPVASPDGQLLAARLTAKGAVGVWESATGKEVAAVPTGPVTHLALGAGNRLLVTADGRQARAWDLADGKERWRWSLPMSMTDSWGRKFVRALYLLPDGRRAFTAFADGTGLILDLAPAADRPASKAPDEKTLAAWWADLAGADARRAYAVAWRLREAPAEAAVAFLRRHLRPAAAGDVKAIRKHIEDLDSDEFATREKAQQALAALGWAAVPEMSRALAKKPSLEPRRRLEKLLAEARRLPLSAEDLRGLRAVQVLEASPSATARRLLAELARGAAHAPLTAAAAAALGRVEHR
jgi:WD40 repeat protein